ncbi:MAG: EamA family transporter [Hyphomicrobiales bacterium]
MSKTTPACFDVLITALAPAIWGSSYLVTTELLPADYPLHVAMLRALPTGLLLLIFVRQFPQGIWWLKIFVLGGLNFSIFWWLLFEAAYRLPGGVAATLGAIQPLLVIFLARGILGTSIRTLAIIAALMGLIGVALLILKPSTTLDPVGILAGIGGAFSMALGVILSRKWRASESLLTFTAWQLTAGGLLLLPAAIFFEPALPPLTGQNVAGLLYLSLIGAAFTYVIWFRGIALLQPSVVSTLGFLSPTTAVILGWAFLDEHLNFWQILGLVFVLVSVWLSQTNWAAANKATQHA